MKSTKQEIPTGFSSIALLLGYLDLKACVYGVQMAGTTDLTDVREYVAVSRAIGHMTIPTPTSL